VSPGHRLRVAEVVEETHDARSVAFEVPAELADRFAFRPGQFLTLRIPTAGGGAVARCYSLSSAPGDGPPTITVKRVAGGRGSTWVCDELTPGDEVQVLPPAGTFARAPTHRDVLLVAGGSGITPLMSILRALLAGPDGSAVLVYANRDERSVIFAGELRALAAAHPDRLVVLHLLESVQGLPTLPQLRTLLAPHAARDAALLCGPAPFMELTSAALAGSGMPVLVERFRSLENDPFDEVALAVPEPAEAAASVDVELDGERHTLAWPPGVTLLQLLLAHDVDAPFSCQEGACSACACRVVAGEVRMLRNEVLEAEDLAEGYVLACQAVPLSDHVEVSYD
jgi:3-ketosteroid 9alpha-monooxygenase subunit B